MSLSVVSEDIDTLRLVCMYVYGYVSKSCGFAGHIY